MAPSVQRRLLGLVCILALGFSVVARGQEAPAKAGSAPANGVSSSAGLLPPEVEQALMAQLFPFWTHDESVTVKAGWCENPLLSSYAPVGRGFVGGHLEAFVWHMPIGGRWEGGAMLDGEVERYLNPLPGAAGEQHWFLHGDLRWTPGKPYRLSLSPEIYYFDQVLDLSQTAAQRYVLPVKVLGMRLKAVVRRSFGSLFAAEAGVSVAVARYREVPENNTEPGGLVRLIWTPDKVWTLEAGAEMKRRSYSERAETTVAGRSLWGTRLHFAEQMADVKLSRKWTGWGTWEASVKANAYANRDEGTGFYDFDLVGGAGSVEWTQGKWTVELDVDASHTRYRMQTVGQGLAPPHRSRNDVDGTLRVARRLGKVVSAYVEVERESSLTNLENASYHNLVATGAIKLQF